MCAGIYFYGIIFWFVHILYIYIARSSLNLKKNYGTNFEALVFRQFLVHLSQLF